MMRYHLANPQYEQICTGKTCCSLFYNTLGLLYSFENSIRSLFLLRNANINSVNKVFKKSIKKSATSLLKSLPVLIGVIFVIGIFNSLLTKDVIKSIFFGNEFIDAIVGSVMGSISAGNPVTSYIISGELLKNGVALFAVTSFMVAWVTVGVVQLPAESVLLGKKFAITRNVVAFFFSIIVAAITCFIVSVI